jgi:hypothetical protein
MPARAKLPIANPETGEILEVDALVYLYGEDQGAKDRNFTKVFHAFLDSVFKDKEIMAGPFRLIAYVMAEKLQKDRLDFHLTFQEIKERLGISEKTYYRWVSVLLRKGYIKRLAPNYYFLRPYTAVVGRMANIDYFEEV